MRTFKMNEKTYPVWKNGKGYACVSMSENGYQKAYLLHRLVWELEYGPVPDGYELHHIDHDKGNWRLENLLLLDRQTHQELHRQYRRSTSIYHKAGRESEWKINPDKACERHVNKNAASSDGGVMKEYRDGGNENSSHI